MNEKMMDHSFSVELNSKEHVRLVTLDTDKNKTIIEGFLGELLSLNFVENVLLEIKGQKGTLRIDLGAEDLKKLPQHENWEVF